MLQTYERKTVRASAVLTGSYVAGTVITDVENCNQLVLFIDFTIGSLTDLLIKIEFSDDGNNYYQEVFSAISAGVSTDSAGEHKYTATGKYYLPIPIKTSSIKVSAKGTGTVTNSLLAISAVVGVA
jgi:hypothetical protein